jgi:formamidopyrimidine-DNA glycosylase
MPELAEVETARLQIEKYLLNQKITELKADSADKYLFAFSPLAKVKRALQGRRIVGTGRKGKYFWLILDKKPWPIFHLGMSGNIAIISPRGIKTQKEELWEGVKLWSADKAKSEIKFCRLLIKTADGIEMGFIDPRRFGRMWLAEDPLENSRVKALGFDPLLNFPSAKILFSKLIHRRKSIKSVLLDQSLFSGIGNWLADEILYHAKISPHRLSSDLSLSDVVELRKKILYVVKVAVKLDADYHRFPEHWLFSHRWGRSTGAKTSRGQKIKRESICGRTAAWVPGFQK